MRIFVIDLDGDVTVIPIQEHVGLLNAARKKKEYKVTSIITFYTNITYPVDTSKADGDHM